MSVSFDFDRVKAEENSSKETLAFLDETSLMTKNELFDINADVTFSVAFKMFTRLSLLVTRRRPELAVHCILLHVMPYIGNHKVSEINRLLINRTINPLVAEGKIVQSRRIFAVLKKFLSWCSFQGIIETSPLADMSVSNVAGGAKPSSRHRILSDDEIFTFWHMWDGGKISEVTKWAARLVLCSARRPDEVLKARRAEFDLQNEIWNQGSRNKSNREHSMPISSVMRECIESLIAAGGDSEWLVPSPKNSQKPASKVLISQALRRMLNTPAFKDIEHFEVRDLRRTARSTFSRLGVPQEVSRKIMNHSLEGIDNVYDRHDYLERMRKVLESYSDFIIAAVK